MRTKQENIAKNNGKSKGNGKNAGNGQAAATIRKKRDSAPLPDKIPLSIGSSPVYDDKDGDPFDLDEIDESGINGIMDNALPEKESVAVDGLILNRVQGDLFSRLDSKLDQEKIAAASAGLGSAAARWGISPNVLLVLLLQEFNARPEERQAESLLSSYAHSFNGHPEHVDLSVILKRIPMDALKGTRK